MSLRVAVIGAGMAGVAAAKRLTDGGCDVTVFERSRGFGGRCASKRWEGHVVDHGAQYFTVRNARFSEAIQRASGEAVQTLSAPVLDERDNELLGVRRHFHRDGNSRLVRDLARGLDVRTEVAVDRADMLVREAGGEFDRVVSTAPLPQTARLFGMDEVAFDYVPCITVLLAYSGEWMGRTRECYAMSDWSGPLQWSACENHKPGRIAAGNTVIVAQMSQAFSREHLERPPTEYPALVRPLVEDRWKLPAETRLAAHGHCWRYARVTKPMSPMNWPTGLQFTGDALTGSRLEDAWLAGDAIR